jgi:hypothetical protein
MITICKFDKKKDFQEYVPDLALSIEMALVTGVVKDTADSTPYTKLKEVSEVGSYLHDPIDIAMAADRLGRQFASQSQTQEVKSE